MKIIIPVKEKTEIASGFNATPEVCVFDKEKDIRSGCSFLNWRDIIPPGTKITKQLKELGIFAVLTEEMQLLALNLFRDNGIEVYKSNGTNLYDNLSLLLQDRLDFYSVEEAMENNKLCSGKCGDCETDTCK